MSDSTTAELPTYEGCCIDFSLASIPMMLTPFMVVGDMFLFDDDTLEPSNPPPQLPRQASGKAP